MFLFLVAMHVHDDHQFCFTVLGDQQWLAALRNIADNLRSMAFEVADRLDLGREFHGNDHGSD